MADMQKARWSISRLSLFETCAKKFEFKYIAKIPEVEGPAMRRGSAIHAEAETYLKKKVSRLPASLVRFGDDFRRLRKRRAAPEAMWAFDRDWNPVRFDDTFKDWDHIWLLAKTDAHYTYDKTVVVVDFKTGAVRASEDQEKLYALAALAKFADAAFARPEFWYLDHGTTFPETPNVYARRDVARMKKEFEARAMKIEKAKRYSATPGRHCNWCSYSKTKGGPCKAG